MLSPVTIKEPCQSLWDDLVGLVVCIVRKGRTINARNNHNQFANVQGALLNRANPHHFKELLSNDLLQHQRSSVWLNTYTHNLHRLACYSGSPEKELNALIPFTSVHLNESFVTGKGFN